MRLHRGLTFLLMLFTLAVFFTAAQQPAHTVPVVMLSDIHLDPFHDPAKVPALVEAEPSKWAAILSAPASATQAEDFAAVQSACNYKGSTAEDSSYALFTSALAASRTQHPVYVTVTGDLLVHNLDCRYRAALKLPKSTSDDESLSAAFAEKTTNFVIQQVEAAFNGIPVYIALGNNDSRCNHNRMDLHDEFLQATALSVIEGLTGISAAERKKALATYSSAGYYSVRMGAPMQKTRLLVIDDIFLMTHYADCEADEHDQRGADETIAWLKAQLDSAHKRHEKVWVMGHLPPTINASGSLSKLGALCTGESKAAAYLSSGQLADLLMAHAADLRLALFGHTHMDEFALLGNASAGVPIRIVPSITPVSGNNPSFTFSAIDPAAARLRDYTVYMASNKTGIDANWNVEYKFTESFHEPDFTPGSLSHLIARLTADSAGETAESRSYINNFGKGLSSKVIGAYVPALVPVWSGYSCGFTNTTPESFKACVCKQK